MNYSNTVIRDGLNGSGQKVYAVQATKHLPSGRDLQVHEVFASKAEAEAWINHAMPNNDYQEPRPEEIDARLAADVTHSASEIGTYRSRFN